MAPFNPLWAVAAGVFVSVVVMVGYMLRPYLPWRENYWDAVHGRYLEIVHEGHDLVAEVEWSDGQVTYMGADYSVEDEAVKLENGLTIKVEGRGGEPVMVGGVPVIRCFAGVASPFDTGVAIAMELEEAGEYTRVDAQGREIDSPEPSPQQVEQLNATVDPTDPGPAAGPAVADGGAAVQVADDHEYDLEPPQGFQGWAFTLQTAAEYVPNVVSPLDLKFAEERGKQSERTNYSPIKTFLLGMGTMFVLVVLGAIGFIAFTRLMGGGQTIGMLLPVLAPAGAGARLGAVRKRLVAGCAARVQRRWS